MSCVDGRCQSREDVADKLYEKHLAFICPSCCHVAVGCRYDNVILPCKPCDAVWLYVGDISSVSHTVQSCYPLAVF